LSSGHFRSLFEIEDEPLSVFLPISHDRLIVARDPADMAPVDVEILNAETAKLSGEFFVAKRATLREIDYALGLGSRADIKTPEEWAQMEREVLEGEEDE